MAEIQRRWIIGIGLLFAVSSEGFWLGLQADYDLEEARHGIAKELLRVEQARAQYRVAQAKP